jgi:MOSC domain-containing protein YiiM
MEEQVTGLKKALTDNWRGGILCRVISGGTINIDDRITLEETPIS